MLTKCGSARLKSDSVPRGFHISPGPMQGHEFWIEAFLRRPWGSDCFSWKRCRPTSQGPFGLVTKATTSPEPQHADCSTPSSHLIRALGSYRRL